MRSDAIGGSLLVARRSSFVAHALLGKAVRIRLTQLWPAVLSSWGAVSPSVRPSVRLSARLSTSTALFLRDSQPRTMPTSKVSYSNLGRMTSPFALLLRGGPERPRTMLKILCNAIPWHHRTDSSSLGITVSHQGYLRGLFQPGADDNCRLWSLRCLHGLSTLPSNRAVKHRWGGNVSNETTCTGGEATSREYLP